MTTDQAVRFFESIGYTVQQLGSGKYVVHSNSGKALFAAPQSAESLRVTARYYQNNPRLYTKSPENRGN